MGKLNTYQTKKRIKQNPSKKKKNPSKFLIICFYLHITGSNCTLMACRILMCNASLKSKKPNFNFFTIKPDNNQVIE